MPPSFALQSLISKGQWYKLPFICPFLKIPPHSLKTSNGYKSTICKNSAVQKLQKWFVRRFESQKYWGACFSRFQVLALVMIRSGLTLHGAEW